MKNIKNIFKYIKNYKSNIIIILILSIFCAILSIMPPKILSSITNRLIDKISLGLNSTDYKFVFSLLIICLLIYIFINITKYFNSLFINKMCNHLSYEIRNEISLKMNKLNLNYYDKTDEGNIVSLISNDVDNISNNLEQILTELISNIISFILVIIVMFSISKLMTLITILIIPIQMLIMIIIMIKSQKYFNKKQISIENIDNKIISSINAHKVIKFNNSEKYEKKEFNKINNELYENSLKSDFLSSSILPVINLVNNLSYIIISIIGGKSVIKGNIKIGDIQAFLQYIQIFNENSETLSSISGTFQTVWSSISRINKFLELEEENNNSNTKLNNVSGKIEFKDVTFSYDNKHNIIKKINMIINPGETIAIVGATGSGKTTIINLLMKFYTNYSGQILIDDIDIKDINTKTLRNKIGSVIQNSFVYHDTVLNNIKFGNNIDKLKFKYLTNKFNLNNYVDYDLLINEDGTNISYGQKQLISIFRAMVNNNSIIVLDEATSNIDTRTELIIQNLTRDIMKNKTSIIIAHRLSTIKNAKCIFVMDNGKIIESGTHEELLKLNGKYKELCDNS